MKVLVCINAEFARDQQVYIGENTDDLYSEENENGWQDASGAIVLAVKDSDDVQTAIDEVAKFYDCPTDRFTGYQIV